MPDVSHEHPGVRRRLGHLAGSLGNRVLEEFDADAVLEHVDVDALVARIDIDALVARIDVGALVARIDVGALVARIDVDELLGRIDVGELVGRVDIDALVARTDLDALIDRVDVNTLVFRVDVDGLLDRVDVDRVLDRVDADRVLDRVTLDRLLDRIDVDVLVSRLDLDAQLRRVDVDALLRRVDVDALLRRVDVDGLLDRADVNAVLDRVDVHRLLDRVDLDRVMAAMDVDAVMARVDLERMLDEVDLERLVRRAGIPELVADSTGKVAGSALDLGRRQLVGLDVGISRFIQRLMRRDPDALPAGPPTLVADGRARIEPPDPEAARAKARFEVSGFYAGPLSRVAAFAGDVALATSAFTAGVAALSWVLATLLGAELPPADEGGVLWLLAYVGWLFVYWMVASAVVGRTPVMALAGLRIVSRDGTPLRPRDALVRTLVLPLSLVAFGIGGAWMVVDRERRAWHDLLAGSSVVYDWGGRPAQLPTPLARWIAIHGESG
jgi:uncharacterized RDD family membrane protein YckC